MKSILPFILLTLAVAGCNNEPGSKERIDLAALKPIKTNFDSIIHANSPEQLRLDSALTMVKIGSRCDSLKIATQELEIKYYRTSNEKYRLQHIKVESLRVVEAKKFNAYYRALYGLAK